MYQSVFLRHIKLGAIMKPPYSRFGVQVEYEVARLPINKTDNCLSRPTFNCRPSRNQSGVAMFYLEVPGNRVSHNVTLVKPVAFYLRNFLPSSPKELSL